MKKSVVILALAGLWIASTLMAQDALRGGGDSLASPSQADTWRIPDGALTCVALGLCLIGVSGLSGRRLELPPL